MSAGLKVVATGSSNHIDVYWGVALVDVSSFEDTEGWTSEKDNLVSVNNGKLQLSSDDECTVVRSEKVKVDAGSQISVVSQVSGSGKITLSTHSGRKWHSTIHPFAVESEGRVGFSVEVKDKSDAVRIVLSSKEDGPTELTEFSELYVLIAEPGETTISRDSGEPTTVGRLPYTDNDVSERRHYKYTVGREDVTASEANVRAISSVVSTYFSLDGVWHMWLGIPPLPPNSVTDLVGTMSDDGTSTVLTWTVADLAEGGDSYEVWWNGGTGNAPAIPGQGVFLTSLATSATTYTHTGKDPTIGIAAYSVFTKRNLDATASAPASVTVNRPIPTAPLAFQVRTGDLAGVMDLSWTAPLSPAGMTGYTIRYAAGYDYPTSPTDGMEVVSGFTGLSYTHTGLISFAMYSYTIFAETSPAGSWYGLPATGQDFAGSGTPGPPTAFIAVANGTTATSMTWAAPLKPADLTSYTMRYTVNSNSSDYSGTLVGTYPAGTLSAGHSGLTASTKYGYFLYASNAVGDGLGTNDYATTATPPPPVPGTPSLGAADFAMAGAIWTSWTMPSNISDARYINFRCVAGPAYAGTVLRSYKLASHPGGAYCAAIMTGPSGTYTFDIYLSHNPASGNVSAGSNHIADAKPGYLSM